MCRRQNKSDSKNEIYGGKSRKHCGKRRKCWLAAFSPFSIMFSKACFSRGVKSQDCVVKGEIFTRQFHVLTTLREVNIFQKTLFEKEKMLINNIFSLSNNDFKNYDVEFHSLNLTWFVVSNCLQFG